MPFVLLARDADESLHLVKSFRPGGVARFDCQVLCFPEGVLLGALEIVTLVQSDYGICQKCGEIYEREHCTNEKCPSDMHPQFPVVHPPFSPSS